MVGGGGEKKRTIDGLVISVELRRLLLAEERLENDDLSEADEDDGDGDEGRPDHDPLVEILGAFATLKI